MAANQQIVSFKKSRIIQSYILLAFFGFIISFVPFEFWSLALFNEILALLAVPLFFLFLRKNRHTSKRYFSLLSFVLMMEMAIFFVEPILRIFYGSILFWFELLVLIFLGILSYRIAENTAQGFLKPGSKFGLIIYAVCGVIIGLGTIVYRVTLAAEIPDAFPIAIILYIFSLMFLFICPIMLIRPERVEDLKKGRYTASRK
ncbi:hypothetical protein AN964_18485 [Heyndrickxia shackletonii]|uniref:Uncharacterized protein n=1 Tax=Heyndrickxia shackletonii TaxID=157838 RepID=A0A0Q3TBR7_9BACI|nr:hypothetical protein [Heyndrickxia shackletonii]KQL51017.1 hypothetical protein AN964_18485 [Heyndrickxia shackletonii]MBB2481862.1 hypothetical protein [Bacillus sp. APMAM]NEZ02025.1 hypothetical protein [Heyndrickxia shackletonii]RTZ54790.1 hypothetical protein EKO25_16175 [Bacillus sp. SAJ1]